MSDMWYFCGLQYDLTVGHKILFTAAYILYSVTSSNNTIQLTYNFSQTYPVALFLFEKCSPDKLGFVSH